MKENKNKSRYITACLATAPRIGNYLLKLPQNISDSVQEIRLRLNRPVTINCSDKAYFITENGCFTNSQNAQPLLTATQSDIHDTFQSVCNYSVYSRQNEINNGYITIQGGHRAGICGTAVVADGQIINIRDISTISIRIAREIIGCSAPLLQQTGTDFNGLLICGPPCSGKTTVLRDIARVLSLANNCKVAVIDSRGEIAGTSNAVFQNDIGMCDILDCYPRDKGITHAIRSLSPDYIICDEIGSEEDVKAIEQSVNSGVKIIATVHAASPQELIKKQYGKALLQTGAFEKIAFLYSREKAGAVKSILGCAEVLNA